METLKFSILINADRQKVWDTMLNLKTYREWTKAFDENSSYEGSWSKGSEIRFTSLDDNENVRGMFSKIKDNVEPELMVIEHLGMINNGVVVTTSEEVKKWTGSTEKYMFEKKDGKTELKIEVRIPSEYRSMFEEMWPKALNALKELCEKTRVAA